ncbi:hypothetical protein EVAR_92921_1 [Eumeta japonica]|uniref:Uncharacterized protein n=1 Tax=Eumeta variegata TaxID=151549 RepID=A0A4C1TA84_EUMVA|nr:hypothetical protein EVAR_92921_1 [Eumeta japonica]
MLFLGAGVPLYPSRGLIQKKTSLWPHKKINATLACKKQYTPKTDWETFKHNKLLGPYGNYDTARAVEIAAVEMSTCDESSVKNIVDNEKPNKRRRKKPARYDDGKSLSNCDSDDQDNGSDKKAEGKESDDPKKLTLPSFNYKTGYETNNDHQTEQYQDDLLDTQVLDYGDYFDDPPHPNYRKSVVTSKPVIWSVETVVGK